MKAYATRVGAGPFPTELTDEIGAGIAARGHEVGTTTGRARRVGWFDAVSARYAVLVNSVSSIMLNKLDILSGVDPIRLCVAYEIDGRRVEAWPSSAELLGRACPVYESFDGWSEPIHAVRSLSDLPEAARRYVTALEEHAGRPDRARLGRAGANADDRAGLAADAPPSGGGRMSGAGALVQPTRILIVGGGGREHALAWKLAAEPGVNEVLVAPGSDGIATEPRVRCEPVDPLDGRGRRRDRPAVRRGARRHRAGGAAGRRGRRRARGRGVRGLRPERRRGPDRELEGVLPGGRRGGGRPDRPGPGVRPDGSVGGSGLRDGPRRGRPGRRQGRRARGRQGRHRLRVAGRGRRGDLGAAGRVRRRGAAGRAGGERHRPVRRPARGGAADLARPQAARRRRHGPEHGRDGRRTRRSRTCRTTRPRRSSTGSTGRSWPSWPGAGRRSAARSTPG